LTNNEIRALLETDPLRLVRLMERNALEGESFVVACELAGQKMERAKIQPVLLRYLKKAKTANDWEAVMGGLNWHLDQTVLSVVQKLKDSSPSHAIRLCAGNLLEDLAFDENEPDPDDNEIVHV